MNTVDVIESFGNLPKATDFTNGSLSGIIIKDAVEHEIIDSLDANQLPSGFQYYFYNRTDLSSLITEVSHELDTNQVTRKVVAHKIGQLVLEFTDILKDFSGDNRPFVSLRTVDEKYVGGCVCNQCDICTTRKASVSRDWHVDTSQFTLTTALAGCQVAYASNDNVNRSYFLSNKIMLPQDDPRLALYNPEQLFPKGVDDVLLLKGELRRIESPSTLEFLGELGIKNYTVRHEGQGLVHHAPSIKPQDKRLVLTISSFA